MTDSLAASVALSVVTGIIYTYVGYRLGRRQVSVEARTAQALFATFWWSVAFSSFVTAGVVGLYLTDHLPLWLYHAIVQVQILVIMLALFGLMYYLVYVYTGNNRWFVGLALVYFLFWAVLVGLIEWVPQAEYLTDDGWQVTTGPEPDIDPLVGILFLVALIGPQFAAAIAYACLFRKATENTQRYRIALVSGTIIIWFGTSLVGGFAGAEGDIWHIVSRMLGLVAALSILGAYLPPAWAREKWDVRSISDEERPVAGGAA